MYKLQYKKRHDYISSYAGFKFAWPDVCLQLSNFAIFQYHLMLFFPFMFESRGCFKMLNLFDKPTNDASLSYGHMSYFLLFQCIQMNVGV